MDDWWSEMVKKLPLPFAVLIGGLVFSYFANIGWWAASGFMLWIAAFFSDDKKYEPLFIFLVICFFLFLIFGIIAMGWSFSIF